MFTGIIQNLVKTIAIESSQKAYKLTLENFEPNKNNIKLGDSIAINGVCLTVSHFDEKKITFDLLEETIKITNLSRLKPENYVNVEKAMKIGEEFGGHIVQGHVDATAEIIAIEPCPDSKQNHQLKIAFPKNFTEKNLPIITKGSIAIDGMSLTIAKIASDFFTIEITPFTFANTNLKYAKAGNLVNIEFDIIGKYVQKLMK